MRFWPRGSLNNQFHKAMVNIDFGMKQDQLPSLRGVPHRGDVAISRKVMTRRDCFVGCLLAMTEAFLVYLVL
jgi:hypothetical protein